MPHRSKLFLQVGEPGSGRPLLEVARPANYRLLLTKYTKLVNELGSFTAERFALGKLASWITQSRLGALALIERDRIVLGNARFARLAKISSRKGKWRPCGRAWGSNDRQPLTGLGHASLAEVIIALAGRMLLGSLPGMVNVRFRRERSRQVVNLRLELGPRGPERDAMIVLALVDDVTHAARSEEELARARQTLLRRETLRAVGEIASGVAHDLANLLAAMQMRTALMKREAGISETQKQRLNGLDQILSDGAGMLTRLQDFARVGQERQLEPVDLGAVIRQAVEMACTSVTAKAALAGMRISIILKLDPLPPVWGIAADLRQMFINLLLNARDAMPGGGNIEISARAGRGCAVVRVEDQGGGVPPELRERVFDPFFTTKGERGTGLGLSMARDLMLRLGGRISVANRRPCGAVFTLRFPSAPPAEALPEP